MTAIRTSAFQPDAGTSIAWETARAQLARPRPANPTFEYVSEELALRDLIARYAYTWDQGDIGGVLTFFTEDCAITNAHGTAVGTAAILANYQGMHRDVPRRRHLLGNVIVRLSDDLTEGWILAYHHSVLDSADSVSRVVSGLIADNLVKRDGEWKIRARSVCVDTTATCPPLNP
jgi:uncharacterized protein (TIGR02246 family)